MNNIDNIDGIVGSSDNYIHKIGNCYLTKNEEEVLNRYDINYRLCKNNKELIYLIEEYLETDNNDELEWISTNLAERSYYIDTNK